MQKPYVLSFMIAAIFGSAIAAPSSMQVLSRTPIAGPTSWDYLSFDTARRLLYVSRGDHVDVIDVDKQRKLSQIDETAGVHGIALAPSLRHGFTSNGLSNTVTVFDLDTQKTLATIADLGGKPDAIVFDPSSGHVLAFNGKGHSFSVIDTQRNVVIKTIPLPGKPEFAQVDNVGHVFVNLEDTSQLARIDTHTNIVTKTWTLSGCTSPSGLAIDRAHQRLFSVCDNQKMAITDAGDGRQVALVGIGDGPDAVVYDATSRMIFSSNGESGNITAVHQDDANNYRVTATISTQMSARTLALDDSKHRLYLSAATPDASMKAGERRKFVPNSFVLLTVGYSVP